MRLRFVVVPWQQCIIMLIQSTVNEQLKHSRRKEDQKRRTKEGQEANSSPASAEDNCKRNYKDGGFKETWPYKAIAGAR
jgi:hypothetical protein